MSSEQVTYTITKVGGSEDSTQILSGDMISLTEIVKQVDSIMYQDQPVESENGQPVRDTNDQQGGMSGGKKRKTNNKKTGGKKGKTQNKRKTAGGGSDYKKMKGGFWRTVKKTLNKGV
jgi:hypothetical protein